MLFEIFSGAKMIKYLDYFNAIYLWKLLEKGAKKLQIISHKQSGKPCKLEL